VPAGLAQNSWQPAALSSANWAEGSPERGHALYRGLAVFPADR
jgi:hypothetical protein